MATTTRRMNIPPDARLRGQRAGKATQRKRYLQRVAKTLATDLEPLTDRIPIEELMPIAARIYKRGFEFGWHRFYTKYVRDRERAA